MAFPSGVWPWAAFERAVLLVGVRALAWEVQAVLLVGVRALAWEVQAVVGSPLVAVGAAGLVCYPHQP